MPKQIYNWEKLKQEFFESDALEVNDFIRKKLGRKIADSGNVQKRIIGWSEEKRVWKKQMLENAKKEAEKELMERLKISLEDLLINKKLLFSLDAKYLEILGKMTDENKKLTKAEERFFYSYQDKIRDIYKRIQIELGLPVNIEELQGRKDKPLVFIDLIRQAEQAEKDAEQSRNNPNKKGD